MEIIWKNNKKDKTYNAYRLLGTGGKSSDGPWIEEVEIYSDFKYTPENGKLLTVQDLQTLEATIFKSSHIDNYSRGGKETKVQNLIDGKLGNNVEESWAYKHTGEDIEYDYFFGLNLKEKTDVVKVVLHKNNTVSIGKYKLQGTNKDGNIWNKISCDEDGEGTIWEDLSKERGTGSASVTWRNTLKKGQKYKRYRLIATGGSSSSNPWIQEVKVYTK